MSWLKSRAHNLLRRHGRELVRWPLAEPLAAHLQQLFRVADVNCVLDVGAHYGEFAQLLRGFGYTGRIISFEPDPDSYRLLAERALLDTHWRTLRMALGAEDGTAMLNIMHHDQLNSLRAPSLAGRAIIPEGGMTLKGVEEVDLRRVDSIFEHCVSGIGSPRVFLKVDVQGYDLEVFRGASASMHYVVALQSEVSAKPIYEHAPPFGEAIQFLRSLGFDITGFFSAGSLANLAVIDLDCVMVRADIAPCTANAGHLIGESWKGN
jgi:FkbM family methyltransferase